MCHPPPAGSLRRFHKLPATRSEQRLSAYRAQTITTQQAAMLEQPEAGRA
ncbi:MAG: hypothetical protein LBD24_07420 [Spirochaetaceae bacterium]|nr:hypothetical protein [Spirochaetaceae bacterium]